MNIPLSTLDGVVPDVKPRFDEEEEFRLEDEDDDDEWSEDDLKEEPGRKSTRSSSQLGQTEQEVGQLAL
jgi:hypothetical protein